jgi:hypothetical protein
MTIRRRSYLFILGSLTPRHSERSEESVASKRRPSVIPSEAWNPLHQSAALPSFRAQRGIRLIEALTVIPSKSL